MERRADNTSSKARTSREGAQSPCSVHRQTVAEAALWTRKNPQLLPTGSFSLSPVVMSLPPLQTGTSHQCLLHLFLKPVLLKLAGKGGQGPIKSFQCLQIALVVDILSLLSRITKLLGF